MVIRPLPVAIIGRTCLKVYPSENRRHYPVNREYKAHLLGFTLRVNSLAFQEQDAAVSACATSALWSVFQGTGKLFQHSIPSPVEITRIATNKVPSPQRSFPNHGLDIPQIASAINEVGLESELKIIDDENSLQSTIYCYLRAGFPLLLLATIWDASDPNYVKPYIQKPSEGHAIAITGFSLGKNGCTPENISGTLFRHSKIDKIYVHDDQVGPFARMEIKGDIEIQDSDGNKNIVLSLGSSWGSDKDVDIRFAPHSIILPLYHKIRISYYTILENIIYFDQRHIEPIRKYFPGNFPERFEWDVYLSFGWKFQEDIRGCSYIDSDYRSHLLKKNYPRFVWRAIGRSENNRVIEYLFDATDTESDDPRDYLIDIIHYDKRLIEITTMS
jgi:hypothetical protein